MIYSTGISVVIPYFNAASTLERCLNSIIYQTLQPNEIIIVDDASDIPINSTSEFIRVSKYFNNLSVIVLQTNLGAPSARNIGIKTAKFKYVALLDADDIWMSDKLKVQYDVMEKYDLRISGHLYDFEFDSKKNSSSLLFSPDLKFISLYSFLFGNPFFTPTIMFRRSEFNGFDERFRRVDDYKAWFEHNYAGRCAIIQHTMAAGFKQPIGYSGLTGSIELMHLAYLDVLKTLHREGHMPNWFFYLAFFIELIKYPVRRLRIFLMKLKA
jgi:glycosyltransferase involved in cell wall biosynthesis